MQQSIKEIKLCISCHEGRVNSIGKAMWSLIVLAAIFYFFIYVMLDIQVKNFAQIIKYSIENGLKVLDSAPTSLASAANGSILGAIVIGMCAARLFVYFGQLRFHLKEMSSQQQTLISVLKIQSAIDAELNEKVRETLLSSSLSTHGGNEPSLHLPSETITKICDAVTERVSKLIKGNQ